AATANAARVRPIWSPSGSTPGAPGNNASFLFASFGQNKGGSVKVYCASILLHARRERPRSRAAQQRDELAAFHSITSLARASSVGATVRSRVLAVLRLMLSANLVGCSTGTSPGFAPLRIRSTCVAARRNMSEMLGP